MSDDASQKKCLWGRFAYQRTLCQRLVQCGASNPTVVVTWRARIVKCSFCRQIISAYLSEFEKLKQIITLTWKNFKIKRKRTILCHEIDWKLVVGHNLRASFAFRNWTSLFVIICNYIVYLRQGLYQDQSAGRTNKRKNGQTDQHWTNILSTRHNSCFELLFRYTYIPIKGKANKQSPAI